jgi:hypothetical protein
MNAKQARKFRQELRKALEEKVKKETWNFMEAVKKMTFRQKLSLAWNILWLKGKKEKLVDGAEYYEKLKREHNSNSVENKEEK